MNQEENRNEIEIDIRGLISAILSRLTIIILVGILAGGIAFAYTQYFIDPEYVSTTKVYIVYKQDPNEKSLTTNDLAFATYLANDYQVLIKSRPVLEEVKKSLSLEQSVGQLSSMIEVELEEDTRIMDIRVTSTDPKLAQKIANKVRDVANEKTKSVMAGVEAVSAVDEAVLPSSPAYPNVEKNTMLGFIIGFGIAVIVASIMFILDDTIKTPDDIEKRLGVSVLASIPLKSAKSDDNYGYGYGEDKRSKKEKRKDRKNAEKEPKVEDDELSDEPAAKIGGTTASVSDDGKEA